MARQFLFRVELDGDRVSTGLVVCDDDNNDEDDDDDERIEGV